MKAQSVQKSASPPRSSDSNLCSPSASQPGLVQSRGDKVSLSGKNSESNKQPESKSQNLKAKNTFENGLQNKQAERRKVMMDLELEDPEKVGDS